MRKAQKNQNKAYAPTFNDGGPGRTYDYYDDFDEENNYNQFQGGLPPQNNIPLPGQNADYLDYKLPIKSEKKGAKVGITYPNQLGSAYKEYNNDIDDDAYEYDYDSNNNYSYPQMSKPIYSNPDLLADSKLKKLQMGETLYQAVQNEKSGSSAMPKQKLNQQGLQNTKKDPIFSSSHQGKSKGEFDEPNNNFLGSSNFFSLEDGLNKMGIQDIPSGFQGDEGILDMDHKETLTKEGTNNTKKAKKKKKKDKDSTTKINEDMNKSNSKPKKKTKGAKKNEEMSSELEIGEGKDGNMNFGQPQFFQPLQQQPNPYMINPMLINQVPHPQFRHPGMGMAPQFVQVPMNNTNFIPGMQPQILGPRIVNPNLGPIPMHNQIHPQIGGMQQMPMMMDPRMIRMPPHQVQQMYPSPYNQNFIIQMNNYNNKQQIIPQDQGFGTLNNFQNMQHQNFPLPQQIGLENNQDTSEPHSTYPDFGYKPNINQNVGQPLNLQMFPQHQGFGNIPQGINPMMINKLKQAPPQMMPMPNTLNMGPRFPYNNQMMQMGNPNMHYGGQGIPNMELGSFQSNRIDKINESLGREAVEQNQQFLNSKNQFNIKEAKESKFSKDFDDYDFNKAFPVKDQMNTGRYGDEQNQNFQPQLKYNFMNQMIPENVFKPQNDFENRIFDYNEYTQNDFGEAHTDSVKAQERLDITAKEFIPKSRLIN